MDKIFSNTKSNTSVCPKKIEKITQFDGGSLGHHFHSNMLRFGFHFISNYFFASFLFGQAKLRFR